VSLFKPRAENNYAAAFCGADFAGDPTRCLLRVAPSENGQFSPNQPDIAGIVPAPPLVALGEGKQVVLLRAVSDRPGIGRTKTAERSTLDGADGTVRYDCVRRAASAAQVSSATACDRRPNLTRAISSRRHLASVGDVAPQSGLPVGERHFHILAHWKSERQSCSNFLDHQPRRTLRVCPTAEQTACEPLLHIVLFPR